MRILCIGDVCQTAGTQFLAARLPEIIRQKSVDFTMVNGENSAPVNGISRESAEEIFRAGADVITTGNHWRHYKGMGSYYDQCPYLLRPANLRDAGAPGRGWCLYDMGRTVVAVVNLCGTVFLGEEYDNPFSAANEILQELEGRAQVILVDFHAEATSEKRAMGFFLDGKVTAVMGTHTHVQTADACVLPGGTAYITDLGMTGPIQSILGMNTEIILSRFVHGERQKFRPAEGPCRMTGMLVETDTSGRAVKAEAVSFE